MSQQYDSQRSQIEDESYNLRLTLDPQAMQVPHAVRPTRVGANGSITVSDVVDPERGLLGAYAVYGCEGEALSRPLWGDVDRMLDVFDHTVNRIGGVAYGGDDEAMNVEKPILQVPLNNFNLEEEAKKPRMSLVNRLGVSLFG